MAYTARPQDRMALDRASVRTIDPKNGHLHVRLANIAAARVNDYLGAEVPNRREFGLDPNRMYSLLRPAAELQKAAASFHGRPLVDLHKQQDASAHDRNVMVGSVSNVQWNPPYLQAELTVWDGAAIAGIECGAQREISPGYYYKAVMTPGVHEGVRYDGKMTEIHGDHVAFVDRGRQGRDIAVGDAALKTLRRIAMDANPQNMQAALVKLIAFLQARIPDPELDDIAVMVDGGIDESGGPSTAMDRQVKRRAAQSRIAQDRANEQDYYERWPNARRLMR
jgi:hypothetical protein